MEILRQTWAAVHELFRSWLRVDRIRSMPSDGTLFRVHNRSRLLIGERLFDVVSRSERTGEPPRAVDYELASDDGPATLTVSLTEAHGRWRTTAELSHGTAKELLLEDKVTVLNQVRS